MGKCLKFRSWTISLCNKCIGKLRDSRMLLVNLKRVGFLSNYWVIITLKYSSQGHYCNSPVYKDLVWSSSTRAERVSHSSRELRCLPFQPARAPRATPEPPQEPLGGHHSRATQRWSPSPPFFLNKMTQKKSALNCAWALAARTDGHHRRKAGSRYARHQSSAPKMHQASRQLQRAFAHCRIETRS